MMLKNIRKYSLFLIFLSYCSFVSADEYNKLPVGEAVKITKQQLIINLDFIDKLKGNPNRDEWFRNYWELIYLINLGSEQATDAGIRVLALMPPRDRHYDHDSLDVLARSLSLRRTFWKILAQQKSDIKTKIIDYYNRNPMDYVGPGVFEILKNDYLDKDE